jgi:hypothetical protein
MGNILADIDIKEMFLSERARRIKAEERLRELSLEVMAWWRVVFDTDWVDTLPGETPMGLAARARARLEEMHNKNPAS